MGEDLEGDDEFPSERTRVDSSMSSGSPAKPRAASPKPPPRTAPAEAPPAKRAAKAKDPAKDKLAALQSLSVDGKPAPQSSRKAQPQASGGGSMLPWVLLVLFGVGVGGNWAYQRYKGSGPPQGGDKQPTVKIETVTSTGGNGTVLVAAGFVAAKTPISISAPAGGVVRDVKVQNGDVIKRGQLLVQLDDSAARADLIAAMAELRSDEAQLTTKRKLAKIGAATSVDVAAAEGAVAVARGKLAPINQRVAQAKITSPIDGKVLERLCQPGETVSSSGPVMRVADVTLLVAEVDVVETDVIKLTRGQDVKVTSDATADRVYEGKVFEFAQQADKTRGTVLTRIDLRVPDQSLKLGMSVKCAFQPDASARPRIYVSRTAVDAQGGVFVVGGDGKVKRKTVKSLRGNGATIEITEGLTAGERIVSDASQVKEGQQIL